MLNIPNLKDLSDRSLSHFNARLFYYLFQACFRLDHHFDVDDKVKILIVQRATRKREQLVRSFCYSRTNGQIDL